MLGTPNKFCYLGVRGAGGRDSFAMGASSGATLLIFSSKFSQRKKGKNEPKKLVFHLRPLADYT